MKQFALGALVGLAGGAALAFAFTPREPLVASAPAPAPSAVESAGASAGERTSAPAPRVTDARAPATTSDAGAQDASDVVRLQRELAEARAEIERLGGGARVPFPPDLPSRFGEQELLVAARAAAAEVGGTIDSIDCTEYPCIAVGRAGRKIMRDELVHLKALAAYQQDTPVWTIFGSETDDPGFALGFMPSEPPFEARADDPAAMAELERRRERDVQTRKRRQDRMEEQLRTLPRTKPTP